MGRLGGIFCSPECKMMYYGELDTPYGGGKRKKTRKKRKSNNNTMKRSKRRKRRRSKRHLKDVEVVLKN